MTGQTASEPSRGRRAAILFAVVVALIALDLWSKAAIWTWLLPLQDMGELPTDGHGHQRWPLVGEWFAFMLNENYGAAFGQLDNIPYLLVSGRVLAVVLLAALIWRAPFGQRAYVTALVLILSGALGNLYDNLFKPLTPLPRPTSDHTHHLYCSQHNSAAANELLVEVATELDMTLLMDSRLMR